MTGVRVTYFQMSHSFFFSSRLRGCLPGIIVFFCCTGVHGLCACFVGIFFFVRMLCFTVCFRDWFITTGLVHPKFENDDDDGNASAIFLSLLGLCLYDDTYALLSSPRLISSSSIFVLHVFVFHGLRRYPMFCLCFLWFAITHFTITVLLCLFVFDSRFGILIGIRAMLLPE